MARTLIAPKEAARKEKRSYTLSPDALSVLEELRHEQPEKSRSSLLEGLLLQVRAERQRKRLDQEVTNYYNSLSAEELDEQDAWSEFAMKQAADGLEP